MNYIKFMRGTPELFSALSRKDPDTLYFIYQKDEVVGQLWIGDRLITSATSADNILSYLNELKDVDTSGAKQGMYLGYSDLTKNWVPMSLPQAIRESVMVGASAIEDGQQGLVPAPKANENKKFLRGDGTWSLPDSLSEEREFELQKDLATKASLQDLLQVKTEVVNISSYLNSQITKIQTLESHIETIYQEIDDLKSSTTWNAL